MRTIEKVKAWLGTEKNFLYAIAGFSLLLRLAYVLKTGAGGLSPDAYDWMASALRLAAGEGVGGTWRPPGYIFFLAAVFSVTGKSVLAVKAAQALLGAATVCLVYFTAKALFSRRTASIAAVMLSFYPYLVAYSADLLSETFLTFTLALAVYALVRAAGAPSWKNLVFTGAAVGLCALTKSTVLPFFLLAYAWLWWQTGKLRAPLLAGLFTLLTIAPWTLRNYFHYDQAYVMPVNSPWASLYGSSCDEALLNETVGDRLKGPGVRPVDQFLPADWQYANNLPLPERDKYCREKALGWIKNNPDKFTWLLYRRALHFWRLYPMIAYKAEKAAAIATSGIYFPLAAIGLLLALPFFKRISLLPALFLSYTLVHVFFATMIRYRVPIDPFVLIFAAYAVERAYNALAAGRAAGTRSAKND